MNLAQRYKILFALLWSCLFIVAIVAWFRSGLELTTVPDYLHQRLSEFGFFKAASVYIVLYAIRPLILFPATLLTISSGMIFGPWYGILFTVLGENASANIAFIVARWLGRDWVVTHEHGAILRWEDKIRENAVVSVVMMRLIYLPFDAVNYGCGLTSMRQRDFFVGTFVGIIPGLISFVLLGGSASSSVNNKLFIFLTAIFFFIVGLIIARYLQRVRPE